MLFKVGIWAKVGFGQWLPYRNRESVGREGEERVPNNKRLHYMISTRTHFGWRDPKSKLNNRAE